MLLNEVVFQKKCLILIVCGNVFYAAGIAYKKPGLNILVSAEVGRKTVLEALSLANVDDGSLTITPHIYAARRGSFECGLVKHFAGRKFRCRFIFRIQVAHTMLNNKILFFTFLCLLIFLPLSLTAEEKHLILGGEGGWKDIEKMDGVVKGAGRYGWESISLDTNARKVTSLTDMLLDFENDDFSDVTGNYTITENHMYPTSKAKMGKQSALARGSGGIRLSGKQGSLFGTSGVTGSFMIEFWLNPSIAENGEIILSWRSSRTVVNYPLYQMISASIESNHLLWRFTNVFNGYTADGGSVTIQSYSIIIPNVWTHHSISFDVETGLLEYRIDGKLESLTYVTSNGREVGGDPYTPQLGVVADLDLCPQFTGCIDDFRMVRTAESSVDPELRFDTYKTDGGYFF